MSEVVTINPNGVYTCGSSKNFIFTNLDANNTGRISYEGGIDGGSFTLPGAGSHTINLDSGTIVTNSGPTSVSVHS